MSHTQVYVFIRKRERERETETERERERQRERERERERAREGERVCCSESRLEDRPVHGDPQTEVGVLDQGLRLSLRVRQRAIGPGSLCCCGDGGAEHASKVLRCQLEGGRQRLILIKGYRQSHPRTTE